LKKNKKTKKKNKKTKKKNKKSKKKYKKTTYFCNQLKKVIV
jgi:hypothetical protein